MAKIVLTLEDIVNAEGEPGMTVHWDSDTKADDGGAAYHYCSAFLEFIVANAKTTAVVGEDADEVLPKSEDDPTLN